MILSCPTEDNVCEDNNLLDEKSNIDLSTFPACSGSPTFSDFSRRVPVTKTQDMNKFWTLNHKESRYIKLKEDHGQDIVRFDQ